MQKRVLTGRVSCIYQSYIFFAYCITIGIFLQRKDKKRTKQKEKDQGKAQKWIREMKQKDIKILISFREDEVSLSNV